jgi:hypothetical protein
MVRVEIPFDAANAGRFRPERVGVFATGRARHDLAVGEEAFGAKDAGKLSFLTREAPMAPQGPKDAARRRMASTPGTSRRSKLLARQMRSTARMRAQTPMSTIR